MNQADIDQCRMIKEYLKTYVPDFGWREMREIAGAQKAAEQEREMVAKWHTPQHTTIKAMERAMVIDALDKGPTVAAAANRLGIRRSTIYYYMHKHGLMKTKAA